MHPDIDRTAARALLAFWRAAGVDMDAAEAVYAAAPAQASAPAPRPSAQAKVEPPAQARAAQPPPRPAPARAAPGVANNEASRKLAAAAGSIAALRAAVEAFEGCALKATARSTVFCDGVEDAPVLLLGRAPGKEEDHAGKPFVGRPGQLLDRMLAQIGLDRRTNLLISNTIYWRPPGDRDPTPGEIMACLPFVARLVDLVQPKLLILAGKEVAQTMLKRDDGVMKLRGRRLSYAHAGEAINTMVMLHPAYLMRQPQQKRLAWADLLSAETWLDELGVLPRPRP